MKTLNMKKVASVFAASVFSASIATAAFANPAADNTAEQGSVAEHVQMMHAGKKGMKGNQGGNLLTGKSLEQMKIILELSDDQVTQITAIMDTVKSDKKRQPCRHEGTTFSYKSTIRFRRNDKRRH